MKTFLRHLKESRRNVFTTVNSEDTKQENRVEELPDDWWYRVYLAVIITTVIVLCALWAFSRYFSS
ncbi:MAG TPA: hypothetical protein VF648_04630 [Pyrinomonadaceae bacterium]|jgi:hypothetical protein